MISMHMCVIVAFRCLLNSASPVALAMLCQQINCFAFPECQFSLRILQTRTCVVSDDSDMAARFQLSICHSQTLTWMLKDAVLGNS